MLERPAGPPAATALAVLAVLLMLPACTGDGSTQVHAAEPAAIAEAAGRVTSGHFEVVYDYEAFR